MYVNCQGALAIEIWPGIFILKNLKVHQNQKNGAKQPNGYILSAYFVLQNGSTLALFMGGVMEIECIRQITRLPQKVSPPDRGGES